MKRMIKKAKKVMATMLMGTIVCANSVCAFASNQDNLKKGEDAAKEVLAPAYVIIGLFLSIAAIIGVVMIIKGATEAISSYNEQDSRGVTSGLKLVVTGLLLTALSTILTIAGLL